MHKMKIAVVAGLLALSGGVLAPANPGRRAAAAGFLQGRDQDHRSRPQDLYARRPGRKHHRGGSEDGIIMVDGEYAPLHDKIKAAIVLSPASRSDISSTPIFTAIIPAATRPLPRTAPPWWRRKTSGSGWPTAPSTA